jgi:hypothetical protein
MDSRAAQNSLVAWLMMLTVGCMGGKVPLKGPATPEDQVQQTFFDFQSAIRTANGDKLWTWLDDDSRSDVVRAVKAVQAEYDKKTAPEKAEMEKGMGLTAAEMTRLTGPAFLKSKRFLGAQPYNDVGTCLVQSVNLQGDTAAVAYIEDDGDHGEFTFVRIAGQWRVSAPIPKSGQP